MEGKVTFKNVLHCDKCGDSGIVATGFMEGYLCACNEQRRTLLRMHQSGLADSIREMRFDNFSADEPWQQAMLDTCQRFIAQDARKGLYISGQPGAGKTHLGTAVCAHFIDQSRETHYVTYRELMGALKTKANDESYAQTLGKYGRAAVLYIDDFMKSYTPADVKHTFDLVNMRLLGKAVTIFTSEHSLSAVVRIDEALGSRITQMCGDFTMDIARAGPQLPDAGQRMTAAVMTCPKTERTDAPSLV